MRLLILISLLAFSGCNQKGSNEKRNLLNSEVSTEYYHAIKNADTWIDGSVYGIAGEVENKAATALRHILTLPDHHKLFVRLQKESTPAGKLYACCGLYFTSRDSFKAAVAELVEDTSEITTISADISSPQRVCDIVRSPYDRSKVIRLSGGQTLTQWLLDNPDVTPYYFDIEGGAYPHLFRDRPFGW